MTWLLSVAVAAELAAYPFVAPITLPEAGPVRVTLAGDALGAEPELAAAGLLMVDATGRDVPYAVVPAGDPAPSIEALFRFPIDRNVWEIEESPRPLDALSLSFDDLGANGPFRVAVSALVNGDWRPVGDPEVLYALDDPELGRMEDVTVSVGRITGPFRVAVTPLGRGRPELDFVRGEVLPPGQVAPHRERVEAPEPVLTEEGRARWVVPLPGPRKVVGLALEVDGDLFARDLWVGSQLPDGSVALGDVRQVRRIQVGDARVDLVAVSGLDVRGDALVVDIATDRGRVLPVRAFSVESAAMEVVLRDAGPGPHQLYLGGREEQVPYDLGVGAYELLGLGPPLVVPGPVVANAAYVPLPTREGLDGPGGPVNLARYPWRRSIEGPEGWVRLPLDQAVLARARVDLGDLRVVDPTGAQIPYLLLGTGAGERWATGDFTRTEDPEARASFLRVPLGEIEAPVETVTLRTGADTFVREVSVLRDRGQFTETLRRVTWSGTETGRALTLHVGERVGRELLLRIDHGDNPPLSVESVEVTYPRWEVLARLPAGGAALVYGAPRESRPSYDLDLLAAEVRRMRPAAATLGPEEAVGGTPLGALDKAVVLGAVGVLALGLVILTARVLRAVPVEDEAPA